MRSARDPAPVARGRYLKEASETYRQLHAILTRYVSESVVDSMLAVACRKTGTTEQTLEPAHLEEVLGQLSYGIRLFCPADKVAEMMLELADLAE